MSRRRSTQGRRDGTAQQDRREIRERQKEKRQSCAIMNDGTVILIKGLAHQVELVSSGKVKQFSFVDKLPSRSEGFDWGLVLSEKRLQDALDWHKAGAV